MNWREHVKKKKGLLFLALLALAFSVLVGILSFRLGRRGQEAGEEKAAQEEKETGGSIGFGDGSVVVSPCLPDGTPCDFSAEAAPSSMVLLADRLVPELGSRESVAAAAAFYRREGGNVCRGASLARIPVSFRRPASRWRGAGGSRRGMWRKRDR